MKISVLLIVVSGIIVLLAIIGFKRGILRSLYKFISFALACVLACVLLPYVTDFVNNTSIPQKITDKCEQALEKRYEEKEESKITDEKEEMPKDENELFKVLGISIPEMLEKTGSDLFSIESVRKTCFGAAATKISGWIVNALCFLVTFLTVGLLLFLIGVALKIIEKIPLIEGPNRLFGLVLGVIEGLCVVWIGALIVSTFCTTKWSMAIVSDIKQSPVLSFLYNHNGIIYLMSLFG